MTEDPKAFSVVRALSNLTGDDYWKWKSLPYREAFELALEVIRAEGVEDARNFLIRYGLPDPDKL